MTQWFDCPYLDVEVELTDEREAHIRARHELALADGHHRVALALKEPDEIRRSRTDDAARLFIRWYDDLQGGKYLIVVVIEDPSRHWIVTAYVTDQPRRGAQEWRRS